MHTLGSLNTAPLQRSSALQCRRDRRTKGSLSICMQGTLHAALMHLGVDVAAVDIESEEGRDSNHLACSRRGHRHEADDKDKDGTCAAGSKPKSPAVDIV